MLKDKFGFNFWPSFTDLMLSCVLVVLIILFVVSKMIASGNENLEKVHNNQEQLQAQIEKNIGNYYKVAVLQKNRTNTELKENNDAEFIENNDADIYIINQLDRQTISFSDKVLFDSGDFKLKPSGYEALSVVGPIIKDNLKNLSEIQIQGHADITFKDDFNLELASKRAISVYQFLQNDVKIDPSEHLMSVTSFGKYKPLDREAGYKYNYEKLQRANATNELKAKNRRIEILLFYNNNQM